ncbi:hypothetical protein INR49_002551 [Caranx melampygus]|nr:hypothetical protein INR49_002551 [Caranx melampygus]
MNASSNIKVKRNDTTAAHNRRSQVVVPRKKPKKTGSIKTRSRGRDGCTRLGGICQPDRRSVERPLCWSPQQQSESIGNSLHKAVDLVCDDYGIINAPFSGNLAGPVSRRDPEGNQYDGSNSSVTVRRRRW